MKILQIIPSLAKGGAERMVLDICIELINDGNEVILITFSTKNEYSFLSCKVNHLIIPSFVRPSFLRKATFDVDQLQQLITQFKPDVIHSHLFESEMVLSKVNCFEAQRIIHVHDNMVQFKRFSIRTIFSKRRITNFYERHLVLKSYYNFKRIPQFISISNDSNQFIEDNLPSHFNHNLLHNTVNLSRFANIKLTNNLDRIVIIGSLVDKKGQELAIRVVKSLHEKNCLIYLDILGDGINRSKLEKMILDFGLEKYIMLHGNVDYPEKYFENAFLYLHTAIYEPFGLVLIEAMAAGLPVVCTDAYGNRDLIVEGKNGHLISERNPEIIADCILKLMDNPTKLKEMGIFAKNFSAKCDVKKYVENLKKLYQKNFKS